MLAAESLEHLVEPGHSEQLVRQSVEAGYTDADWMAGDSDLDPLHGSKFAALIGEVRKRHESE